MSPRQDDFIDIHDRLLAGDETASSDLVLNIGPKVENIVASKHSNWRDTYELHDAVVDALFDHIRHPRKFDPARSTFLGFLTMAADRNLRDRMPAASRRIKSLESLDDHVELSVPPPNVYMKGEEETLKGNASHKPTSFKMDEKEMRVYQLMMSGERSTQVFAEAIGLKGLPKEELRKEVKRFKDRLKKRIERSKG